MISKVLWQARAALALYGSVRRILPLYLLAVLIGMIFEALALAAIVPLIGGSGALADAYANVLERLGLPDTEVALLFVIAALFAARAVAQYCSALIGGLVIRREAVRLQVELFRLYLGLRWDEMVKLSRGEVNLLLNTQVHEVAMFLYRCIGLLEGVVYVVGLTIVAIVVSPTNTLLAVGLVGFSGLGVTLLARRVRSHSAAALEQSERQASRLLEYAANVPMLRAYSVAGPVIDEIEGRAVERERLAFRAQRLESLGWVMPDLLFVVSLLTVVGVALGAGQDIASVGAVVALLYRVSQYLKRFSDLSGIAATVPTIRAVHRYRQLFQSQQAGATAEVADASLPPGAIRLDAVGFRYEGAAHDAVRDASLSVEPGSFVGVVGPSGGGKSTLVQLVLGLLEPSSGSVRIGLDSRGMSGVAYVPQAPVLLSGTIASNIRWFRDIDDDSVSAACSSAGLGGLLAGLHDGIHTAIGQDGLTLSGGERQRIALARALAGDPVILVLDEATSALDGESEAVVQRALASLHGSVTVIAVAHRISTVMSADRIVVVEGGSNVESGHPKDLLEPANGAFRSIAARQGLTAAGPRAPREMEGE